MFSTGRRDKSQRRFSNSEIMVAAAAELGDTTGVFNFEHEYGQRANRQKQFATVVRLRNVLSGRLVDFLDDGNADAAGNPHNGRASILNCLKKHHEGVPIFVADSPMGSINGVPVPIAGEHTAKLGAKYKAWADERDKNAGAQEVEAENSAEKETKRGKQVKATKAAL